MSNTTTLKALYYPFARFANPNTLKKALLLFDEVWFVDPTSQRMRDGLADSDTDVPQSIVEEWQYICDLAGPLLEQKIVRLYDAEQLIVYDDQLLSDAFKADLNDNDVWRLCTTPGTPETWDVLRRKVPPSAFEFLNSQVLFRINYGTARAKALFHNEFIEWPDLRGQFAWNATDPFAGVDGLRYFFHDGKVAYEIDWNRPILRRLKKYMADVEFSCVFPFTHASSLAVNQALLISHKFGLVPLTDSRIHHQLLNVKYQRALHDVSLFEESATSAAIQPISARLYRWLIDSKMLTLNLHSSIVPEELLDRISILEAIQLRDSSKQAFESFKQSMGEMIAEIEGRRWYPGPGSEYRIRQVAAAKGLLESRVVIRGTKHPAITVDEQLFGKTLAQQEISSRPKMEASVFPGLDFIAILTIGRANVLKTTSSDQIKAHWNVAKAHLEAADKPPNSLAFLL